eukprot:1159068-Pelagomonas_calceolata.AAC.10
MGMESKQPVLLVPKVVEELLGVMSVDDEAPVLLVPQVNSPRAMSLVPQVVEELLGVMGVDGKEPVPVPSWHYTEDPDEEGAAGSPQVWFGRWG